LKTIIYISYMLIITTCVATLRKQLTARIGLPRKAANQLGEAMKTVTSLLVASLCLLSHTSLCQVAYVSPGSTYTQNFDSLASSGTSITWDNNVTLPGWFLFRQPAPGTAITNYNAGTGSSTTGSFYSFGLDSNDRALGAVGSGGTYWGSPATGAVAGWMAVGFQNNTGATLTSFSVSYNGEQWRYSGNPNAQTMRFEYGFGTAFTTVSSWLAPGGSFDWASPVISGTAGAINGNSTGLVTGRGGTISGLAWSPGQTLWLRWVEVNDAGFDHGLAIDNFTFTAVVPEPHLTGLAIGAGLLALAASRRWNR
jgi:hypothetical protein